MPKTFFALLFKSAELNNAIASTNYSIPVVGCTNRKRVAGASAQLNKWPVVEALEAAKGKQTFFCITFFESLHPGPNLTVELITAYPLLRHFRRRIILCFCSGLVLRYVRCNFLSLIQKGGEHEPQQSFGHPCRLSMFLKYLCIYSCLFALKILALPQCRTQFHLSQTPNVIFFF